MIVHYIPKRRKTAPAELVSVERMIVHYIASHRVLPAPADFTSVERMIVH